MLPGLASLAGFAGDTASSFSISLSQRVVTKSGSSSGGPKTLITSNVTVSTQGGSGSPTFAWSRVSGATAITATSPSSATTAFTATLSSGQEVSAVFLCTVTDPSGAVRTSTVNVNIDLVNYA
jgi:hypothetical protein